MSTATITQTQPICCQRYGKRHSSEVAVHPCPNYEGGLAVENLSGGWAVLHKASRLSVVTGLRQKRFAIEARAEMHATGVDFTQDAAGLHWGSPDADRYKHVMQKWQERAKRENLDPDTFEYYSKHSRYGQVIPSAAKAAELREAVAAGGGDRYERLMKEL